MREAIGMDIYTKIVLTVIACALSAIAWQDFALAPARAQVPPVIKAIICDANNPNRCTSTTEKGWFVVETHPGD
jgi:hypothetical protein